MARLDRLVSAKGIAQLGATIGRQFSYALLHAVSQLDGDTLQRELRRLIEAELLYQRGLLPQATYTFKHALIQDAAYQSLLKSTRQQYHQRIVQVLTDAFPEIAENQPELLAHHYTEAGLNEQAMTYWQKAGQRAIQRSANVEAVNHFTRGLTSLTALPETPEHVEQEIGLQTALGQALMAAKGQGVPEVERTFSRAWALCRQVGESPHLFSIIWGLWRFYYIVAKLPTALELGEQCLSLAQRAQDPVLLLPSHLALGSTFHMLGEFASGRAHLEQGIALYDPLQHRALAFSYGIDLKIWCLSYVAWALWHLGYPKQAVWRSHEALTLAQELAHPFSLTGVLDSAAWLDTYRREAPVAQEHAEAAIALAREHGFPQYEALGMSMGGWALVARGQQHEGLAQLRQGNIASRAAGAELGYTKGLTLLADSCGQAGQVAEGQRVINEALAVVDQTGARVFEAELYRLKGELLSSQSPDNAAEAVACFQRALSIARYQQAKSWELRAATSLARLWQQQGKRQDAHDLLAPVYDWFTEGFDTADLKDAKALLRELEG